MSTNTPTAQLQQAPYLREQRNFPEEDLQSLAKQIDHAYIDIATKVNKRTIGTFAVNFQIITGESWFLKGQPNRQQSLRQVWTQSTTAAITHNISGIDRFVRLFGAYTDGTNSYGLIPGSNVAISGQISFYITPTQIIFLVGAGAPSITQLTVTLEWLSQF